MPPEGYLSTELLVQGSTLIASAALAGFVGVAFLLRSLSRLFAAGSGRL